MSTQAPSEFDVIVVGLGPTGATLANLLGQCGLSVLVLELEDNIYPHPRAVHFDDEIMRVFQSIGITDTLIDQVFINRGMRFVDLKGQLLLDWPRPQNVTNQGWHASYRFHQPDLELLLRKALARHTTVEVLTGQLVTQVTNHEDHASALAVNRTTGQEVLHTSRYIVGCDGARSTVRQTMQSDMQTLDFTQRWLVIDLILNRPMPQLGDYTLQFCHPDRPKTYCRNPGDRRRWEFALHEGESDSQMLEDEHVWQLLKPWLNLGDATLERKAIYTFEAAVAKSFRTDRLLIAGDAAHLTPPFMGQGMCAGIRDAANLAWKLALCCQSASSTEILDTYQSERKPNVTEYIETAVRLGELINRIGEHANQNNPDTIDAPRMKSLQSTLGSGMGEVADRLRGTLVPQVLDETGALTDDYFGYAPVLLVENELFDDKFAAHITKPKHPGIRVINANENLAFATILRELETGAVLVRPDRYILASAVDAAELLALISRYLPFPDGCASFETERN